MPLLDTDVLSIIQRRKPPNYHRLASRIEEYSSTTVWVSIITFEEQLRGWLVFVKNAASNQLPEAYNRLYELNRDYCGRPILRFDAKAVAIFEELRRNKIRIGSNDLRIASIALANDELLVTRNLKDFRRVPDLRTDNWVD